jgi:hypothetical protein
MLADFVAAQEVLAAIMLRCRLQANEEEVFVEKALLVEGSDAFAGAQTNSAETSLARVPDLDHLQSVVCLLLRGHCAPVST